jgi:hypothetical protein
MIPAGDGSGGGGGADRTDTFWIDVNWSWTEPPPTGLAQSFEVVIFTGSDPTDTTKYVETPAVIGIGSRRYVTSADIAKGKALPTWNAAVRTVYPWAKSAWAMAAATVTPAVPSYPTTTADNLIPNPTSEMGTTWLGYGSALVVNDAGNSYAGNWCRKLNTSATNATALTPLLPTTYGDYWSFSAWAKVSSASAAVQIYLQFTNASGTVLGTATSSSTSSTSYGLVSVQGTVPSGAVAVQAFVKASTTAAATFGYFDNLSLRRSVKFGHMEPDAGFRAINALKNTGSTTADRTWYAGNCDPGTKGGAPNISTLTVTRRRWDTTNHIGRIELKLQPTTASDNLDGMRPATVVWMSQSSTPASTGSITATMTGTGGSRTITRNSGGSGSFIADGFVGGMLVTMAGWANSGNNVQGTISSVTATTLLFVASGLINESSRAGVTLTANPALSVIETTHPPIHDRLFANATDSNSANASVNTAELIDAGVAQPYLAVTVTLYNAFGPSDTHCFYSAAGGADGVALVDNGTSFPASFTGGVGGGTGGGAGGGGGCPEVNEMVDLPGGQQKRAGDLMAGDLVYTMDPNTGTVGQWPVLESTPEDTDRLWALTLADGRVLKFNERHRFRLASGGWCEIQDLEPGMVIGGTAPAAVASVSFFGPGTVQRITVDQVHSYQTGGILSSNIKPTQ